MTQGQTATQSHLTGEGTEVAPLNSRSAREGLEQPCARGTPVALDGTLAELQHAGNLAIGHPGKKTHLDDLRAAGIKTFELLERIRERFNPDVDGRVPQSGECHPGPTSPVFFGLLFARPVDQNVPHGGGRRGAKMAFRTPGSALGRGEADPGVVDEAGRRERRIGIATLLEQEPRGRLELPVDHRIHAARHELFLGLVHRLGLVTHDVSSQSSSYYQTSQTRPTARRGFPKARKGSILRATGAQ